METLKGYGSQDSHGLVMPELKFSVDAPFYSSAGAHVAESFRLPGCGGCSVEDTRIDTVSVETGSF